MMSETRDKIISVGTGRSVTALIKEGITLVATASAPTVIKTEAKEVISSASDDATLSGTDRADSETIEFATAPTSLASDDKTPVSTVSVGKEVTSLIKEETTPDGAGRAVTASTKEDTMLAAGIATLVTEISEARDVMSPIKDDIALSGANVEVKAVMSSAIEDKAEGSTISEGNALISLRSDEMIPVGADNAVMAAAKDEMITGTETSVAENSGRVMAVTSEMTEDKILVGIRSVGIAEMPTAGISLRMEETRFGSSTDVGMTVMIV